MGNTGDSNAQADAKPGASLRFRHSRRAGLLRALLINLCVLLLPIGAYYGLIVLHYEQYRHERSFRALAELGAQFDAKIASVAALLNNAPGVDSRSPAPAEPATHAYPANDPDGLTARADSIREFASRITDPRWVPVDHKDRPFDGYACPQPEPYVIAQMAGAASAVDFVDCRPDHGWVSIAAPLESLLGTPSTKPEFEHVLLATARGEVIADLTADDARKTDPRSTPPIADIAPARIVALLETLAAAPVDAGPGAKDDPKKPASPSKNYIVLDAARRGTLAVGAQTYSAYVVPHETATAIWQWCNGDAIYPIRQTLEPAATAGTGATRVNPSGTPPHDAPKRAACIEKMPMLYLVGLNRSSSREAAQQSMNPTGLLVLLTALGCAVALWPLLRLRFLEPHDSLSWGWVRAMSIGVVVALVLLCATGYALTLRQRLFDAALASTRTLAASIADHVRRDIAAHVRVAAEEPQALTDRVEPCPLEPTYGDIGVYRYTGTPELPPDIALILRTDADGRVDRTVENKDDQAPDKWANRQEANIVVNTECRSGGRRSGIRLDQRPYFVAAQKRPWCLPSQTASQDRCDAFSIARLFNLGDGAKLTTIAVPRYNVTRASYLRFDGVTFVDSRLLAYANAVMPYHFQFAIVDDTTGTTIFHSDDAHSLTENFLAEIERPADLETAIERATPIEFAGAYRGASTRFATQPLAPMRWTLVVYFTTTPLELIVLYAHANTAIAVLLPLLFGLALGYLAVRAGGGSMLWLWPQRRLRDAYASGIAATALVGGIAALVVAGTGAGSYATLVLIAATPVALLTLFAALFEPSSIRLDHAYRLRVPGARSVLPLRRRHALLVAHLAALAGIVVAAFDAPFAIAAAVVVLAAVHVVALVRAAHQAPRPTGAIDRFGYALPGPDGNPWDRDVRLDPARLPLDTLVGNWSRRHALFLATLAIALAALPVAAVFDAAAMGQLDAASIASARYSAAQFDTRVRRMTADAEGLRGVKGNQLALAQTIGGHGFAGYDTQQPSRYGPIAQPRLDVACARAAAAAPPPQNWPSLAWRSFAAMHAGAWLHIGASDAQSPVDAWRRVASGDATSVALRFTTRTGTYCVAYPRLTAQHLRAAATPGETASVRPLPETLVLAFAAAAIALVLAALLRLVARRLFGRPMSPSALPQALQHGGAADAGPPRPVLAVRVDAATERAIVAPAPYDPIDLATLPTAAVAARLASRNGALVLRRLDVAMLDPKRRAELLPLLESLFDRATRPICLSVETTPLFRLCRPLAYQDDDAPVDAAEQTRWVQLFARTDKRYGAAMAPDDEPRDDAAAPIAPDDAAPRKSLHRRHLDELVRQEARPLWPTLRSIADRLRAHLDGAGSEPDTEREIVEYFSLSGEVHYRAAWEACPRNERLALYQLARGRLVNVENLHTIDHLKRRGLIVVEPYARLTSQSLAEFVLHAELPGTFERWEAEASEGLWQSIRMPLTIVLLLVLVWIAYSSGEALNVVVALIGTALTFLGTLFRAINFAKAGTAADIGAPVRKP